MTEQLEQQIEQPISLQDVEERKVNFFELPQQEQERLKQEYYETRLPEEDRELLKNEGYVPPYMHYGKNRRGEEIQPKSPEEFKRSLLEKRKPDPISSLKKEFDSKLNEITNLLRMQTTNSIKAQEDNVAYELQQARETGDVERLEKLINKKFEIEKQKEVIQPKFEPFVPQQPQLTPEQYNALNNFAEENKDFTETVVSNPVIDRAFGVYAEQAKNLYPHFNDKEILNLAKKQIEVAFPNSFNKTNVFMNNQYSAPTNTFVNKPQTPKISYEAMDESSKALVRSAAHDPKYLGKSLQQVAESIYGRLINKK